MTMIDFRIRPAGSGDSDDPTAVLEDDVSRYKDLYKGDVSSNRSLTELLDDMSNHDIVGVIQAEYETGDPDEINSIAGGMLTAYPERFVAGIATTDPRREDSLDVLRHAHDSYGLRGLVLQPGFLKMSATDERCMPLYEYCQSRGQIVTIHTGINFSGSGPIDFGRPTDVDRVACDFPDLVLVCNHGGWPWSMETAAILWKHENVYADFGAIAPKYMADPKGGWGPIAHWMNSQISDKILLASDWPMVRYGRLQAELPLLELSQESFEKYTRLNAVRLLSKIWGVSL